MKLIIAGLLVLFIIGLFIGIMYWNAQDTDTEITDDYEYCGQYSYDNCPEDRCTVGPSSPMTTDIGCFPISHYDGWV
ncbi:MAG: hypothetical protein ACMXYL_05895 [Candidatus Woesearchaeota archaeon]